MYAVSQKHFCRCLKSGVRSRHVTRFPFGSRNDNSLVPPLYPKLFRSTSDASVSESDTTCESLTIFVTPILDERSPIGAHKTNYRKTTPPYPNGGPRGCFIISDARLRGSPFYPHHGLHFFLCLFPLRPGIWILHCQSNEFARPQIS
jgi:hypothetical protein